jgi:hypothetical protein
MKHVRDLVIGEGKDFLLVGRVMSLFLRSLDGSLALFDGIGQLVVEMRSISELSIGGLLLRCRRTSSGGEIRSLGGWNKHG